MTTLAHPSPSVKANTSTITIKGNAYRVEAIDPVEEGPSAVRVTKLAGGAVYDVVRTHDGIIRCDCPDYEMRHAGTSGTCKHGQAVAGLLGSSPSPVPSRPAAVPPITRKDVKRAEAFGIKLPAAAKVEVASPAPIAPAPVVAQAPVVEPARTMDDATFKAWKREQVTTLAHPELFDDAPAGYRWEAITPIAAVLVSTVPDRVDYPARIEPEVEYRPTAPARFVPTDEDDAERSGWSIGREGESANAPAGWDFPRLVAFYRGWLAGNAARIEAEREELEGWFDSIGEPDWDAMYPDFDPHHPCEVVEAGRSWTA